MKARSYTIVIVDDSAEDRDVYRQYLARFDTHRYTFLEADTADEGVRICQRVRVDCLLLDFQLPDADGLDVVERLRLDRLACDTPIVMITGRGNESTAVKALQLGALDYLVKSNITPESLYRATQNAIDRAEASARLNQHAEEQAQAQEELRQSEERYRLLTESIREHAIMMLDVDGCVVSWNAGARQMLDYHDAEILGRHYRMCFTPEDAHAHAPERELEAARRLGRVYEDRWHLRKGGERFFTSGVLSAVYDSDGELRGFVRVMRDVTHEKLSRDEMDRTQRQLRDAVAARDEFLSFASHELKTPLTVLKLELQGVLRQSARGQLQLAPELRQMMDSANQQVSRLHSLVDDLLNVSRINGQRLTLARESFELHTLLHEIVDAHRPRFDENNQLLILHADQSIRGNWDRLRVRAVLDKLLTNARKFGRGQPVELRLSTAGGRAFVSVTDRGEGIDPENQRRIFERFERASVAEFTHGGLGLGLFIARKVAEAHGGSLSVRSEKGRGSVFSLELPLEEIAQPQDEARSGGLSR